MPVKSVPDGNYYRYTGTLPEGAINMGALFVAGRLALMMIDYRDFGLGGWEQLVKQTTDKYGPPIGEGRTADWNDGASALNFKHELSGNIKRIGSILKTPPSRDAQVTGKNVSCRV